MVDALTTPVRILLAGVPMTTALGGTDVGTAPLGPTFSSSMPQAIGPATIQTLSCAIAQPLVSGGDGGLLAAATHGEGSDNRLLSPDNPEGEWKGFYSAQCERDPLCSKGFRHGGIPGCCKLRGVPGLPASDGTNDIQELALGMAVQGWLVPIGAREGPQMHLRDHFRDLGKPPARRTQKAFITDWAPTSLSTGQSGNEAQPSLLAMAEDGRDEASCSTSVLGAVPKQRKVR